MFLSLCTLADVASLAEGHAPDVEEGPSDSGQGQGLGALQVGPASRAVRTKGLLHDADSCCY